jgi:hypothetical protein
MNRYEMIRTRLSLCAAGLVVFSSCRPTHITSAPTAPTGDVDAFELVVRVARESLRGQPLRVDPRPIKLDDDTDFAMPSAVPGTDALTAARLRVLRRLRIDTVDATVVGLKETCPGFLTPKSGADTIYLVQGYPGCPRDHFYVHGVGLLRPGVDSAVRADLPETKGLWTVLVVRSRVGKFGADRRVYDYVLEQREDRSWRFVRSILLYILE